MPFPPWIMLSLFVIAGIRTGADSINIIGNLSILGDSPSFQGSLFRDTFRSSFLSYRLVRNAADLFQHLTPVVLGCFMVLVHATGL